MKKTADQIKRVGLVANSGKVASRLIIRKAAALIARAGRTVVADRNTAELAGLPAAGAVADVNQLARDVDLLLVFGGDGTILRVVREIDGARTPILGINIGRLGFLTAVPSRSLTGALRKLWSGDFTIETRPLLEASARLRGQPILLRALNDIVISRGSSSRMIELDVTVGGQPLTRYRCDGLIVSSPTGSTAYSLSAGGAIVSPDSDVFCVTPICPHTLTNRSVIIGLDARVEVRVLSEKVETIVTADGQVQHDLTGGDAVKIRRSRRTVRLVHLGGTSFFDTVRRKLHWSGSNV